MERESRVFAHGAAGIIPLAVAALLVGLRASIDNTNVALVLVLGVVLLGALGGRGPATVAALSAACTFDFFFTRPYRSLRIDDPNDLETALLLLLIALLVAQVAVVARTRRMVAARGRDELDALRGFAARAAAGASDGQLTRLATELVSGLLGLLDCRYTTDPGPARFPLLERSGRVDARVRELVGGDFALPAVGVRLPVVGNGRTLGCLLMYPDPRVGVSIEARVVAVALADQLGAAIASHAVRR